MGEVTSREGEAPGEWVVRADRVHGDASAGAEVVVRTDSAPGPDSPYARLAGGRAWSELGEGLLAAGNADGAIACAQAGLDEVDGDYAPDGVKDDTRLKISAGEERVAEGHAADGAMVLLDVLDVRLALLGQRHGETIVA